MIASRNGNTVTIGSDIAKVFCGAVEGYRIVFHELPKITILVEADSADLAVKIALNTMAKENVYLKQTGHTFTKI